MELTKKQKQNERWKRWYQNNKDSHIARVNRRRAQLKEDVNNLKRKPCTDCGESYPPYVMQFDHLADKKDNVSLLVAKGLRTRTMAEIAKCELVCANCHAVRTHKRS